MFTFLWFHLTYYSNPSLILLNLRFTFLWFHLTYIWRKKRGLLRVFFLKKKICSFTLFFVRLKYIHYLVLLFCCESLLLGEVDSRLYIDEGLCCWLVWYPHRFWLILPDSRQSLALPGARESPMEPTGELKPLWDGSNSMPLEWSASILILRPWKLSCWTWTGK